MHSVFAWGDAKREKFWWWWLWDDETTISSALSEFLIFVLCIKTSGKHKKRYYKTTKLYEEYFMIL